MKPLNKIQGICISLSVVLLSCWMTYRFAPKHPEWPDFLQPVKAWWQKPILQSAASAVRGVPAIQGVTNGTPVPVADTASGSSSGPATISSACADPGTSCAAGTFASINTDGQFGAFVIIPAATTLVGTLKAECSGDGTKWVTTYFDIGDKVPSVALSSGSDFSASIVPCTGQHYTRVRLSAFTSGSAAVSMYASLANDPSELFGGLGNSTSQPPSAAQLGGWSGTNYIPIAAESSGALRVTSRHRVLGCYSVGDSTGAYGGLAAGSELFQMRWGSSTALAVIYRVSVSVVATAAATAAGVVDRQLIIARSWTVSGSGGTTFTLTGNNLKRRTSMATSLVTDMRFTTTSALSVGTKTFDSSGVGIASASMGTAAITSYTAGSVIPKVDLLDAADGPTEYPIVLAQNEGIVVRMLTAEPTSATLRTQVNVAWCEVDLTAFPFP